MVFARIISLSVLALVVANSVRAVAPGTYVITNAQFPEQRVVGTDTTNEGAPLGTFNVRHSFVIRIYILTLWDLISWAVNP